MVDGPPIPAAGIDLAVKRNGYTVIAEGEKVRPLVLGEGRRWCIGDEAALRVPPLAQPRVRLLMQGEAALVQQAMVEGADESKR